MIGSFDCHGHWDRTGGVWRTFLRNHTVWACDVLQTYDVWFRPIFAFFVININFPAERVVIGQSDSTLRF